jgi:uncharacterized alpha-E superfamily protein
MESIAHMERLLDQAKVTELAQEGLHEFIDVVQVGLGAVQEQIAATYFARSQEEG